MLHLAGIVGNQATQVVEQDRQALDAGLIVEQIGIVAGEQKAALRRFGIQHARLDLVDPADHFMRMRDERCIGQRATGTDKDADTNGDEDQGRERQRQLVAAARSKEEGMDEC